jgi:hypothetical protein
MIAMIKRLLVFGYVLIIFSGCTKEQVAEKTSTPSFNDWLMNNCQYRVAEASTGAIIFDASEIKLDGQVISQRGIYYYNQYSPLLFPSIKELSATGYSRDIEIGANSSWCADYRVQAASIQLKVTCGSKTFTWQNCPVLLLEHETLPDIKWPVNIPHTIEMNLVHVK